MKKAFLVIVILLAFFFLGEGLINSPIGAAHLEAIYPSPGSSQITRPGDDRLKIVISSSAQTTIPHGPAQTQSEAELAITSVPDEALVIINGTIIDGTGAEPIPNGLVVIQGNRILAVGRPDDFLLPANVTIIDAAGKTVMPGIINSHAHHVYHPATRHRFLLSGVTSVCDLGSSLHYNSLFEQDYTLDDQPAARGFRAGPIITVIGGYPSTFRGFSWHYQVATPEEAQRAVVDLLNQGTDMIKIALEPGHPQHPWPVLSLEQLQAIVRTAHDRDVIVRAHVRQAARLDLALEAGVDVIEHVPLPFCLEVELEQMLEKDLVHLAAFPQLERQLARMVEQKIVLVPTLDVTTQVINDLPRLQSEQRAQASDFVLEIVNRFHQMGGVIALGNDYGNLEVQPGMPLREMELLLGAGLSPLEIIEASTRHAAEVCSQGPDLGTLESGKLADLVIVDGDPLRDIRAMNKVVMVIKDGDIVDLPEIK